MMKQNWVKKADAASQAILATSIITMGFISLASLLAIPTHADDNTDVVDIVNITVPTACTMGGTIVTGQEHSTSMQPGTYEANIGKTTLTTYCNDPDGFSIYAIGFTGDQYSGTNHTKLVGNNASNTISTGLTTGSSTTDASSWAMKLTAVTGTYAPTIMNGTGGTENFTNYHVVPDTYTKVATFPSTTDAEGVGSTGSSLETTYAVYASLSQPADTYTGKVKYTLVHPATDVPLQPQTTNTGKIHYWPNGSGVVGTMGEQNVASSVTLLASNYSRQGYGFAGWNTEFDYSGTFYGPNETISLNTSDYTGTNPGLSLYAVWVKSQGNLQDSAKVASVCSNLTQAGPSVTPTLASVSALTDQRDNNTYAIAKLADNKCWMIENMRLADKDSNNNDIELSSTNTNNPSLPITNVYDASNPTTSNHLSPSVNPTTTAWCVSNSAACDDQSMLYTGNFTERASSPTTNSNINMYSYGAYYNWYSATAGNGKYSTSANNSTVPGDICPVGWTLPESGDKTNMTAEKNNFYKLGLSLGLSAPANYDSQTRPYWTGTPEGSTASNTYRSYPNNFLYSGYVYGSSVNSRGSNGNYWSKSAYNDGNAYRLYFLSSNVTPSGLYNKYYGFSVRCLAQ